MKIVVLGNYIFDEQESMQRLANILVSSLQNMGHEVRLVRPEPYFGKLRPSRFGIGKWLGYIDKLSIFPITLQQSVKWADIVHICDHGNSFYSQYLQDIPHLVTCSDLLGIRSAKGEFPMNPVSYTGKILQKWILRGLEMCQYVACVSKKTYLDLHRLAKIPETKTSVVYNGLNYNYLPVDISVAETILQDLKIPNAPYFLHVGGNQWYKNRLGVVQIFYEIWRQQPEYHLIMVGKQPLNEVLNFIKEKKIHSVVHICVGINNFTLAGLYRKATALLFPSWEEGFGWPVIEAQACGCPVFTSNRQPMLEIAGQAGIYFNPKNVVEASKIVLIGLKERATMIENGIANARIFSTASMVEKYVDVYKKIISNCP